MKNFKGILILLIVLVSLVGIANAQSNYLTPWPGATHTYTFDVPDTDSEITWWVSQNANGSDRVAHSASTGYTIVKGANGTLGTSLANELTGTGINSVKITWGTAIPGGTYYLFMQVTKDGCSNLIGAEINVTTNTFDAMIADVTGTTDPKVDAGNTDPSNPLSDCPSDVANPIIDGGGNQTDLGLTKLIFRVNRQYSSNGWDLAYAITEADGDAFEIDRIEFVGATGPAFHTESKGSGTPKSATVNVGATEEYVLMNVYVENQEGATLDLIVTLNGTNTKDSTTDVTDSANGNNVAARQIKPMPVINGFTGS